MSSSTDIALCERDPALHDLVADLENDGLGTSYRPPPTGTSTPSLTARASTSAVKLGVLVPAGGGRYEVPSPSLLEVGDEVVERGISLDSALSVLKDIERHSDFVCARSFVHLFLAEIWKPFAQADMPAERWPEVEGRGGAAATARRR